ncbi:MAG: homoserine dehydrogenase [Bacteroidota bacterium]
MSKNSLNIGLFGFGCVGQGLYHVLKNSTGFKANITKIAVKNRNKPRAVSKDLITYNKWEILDDPAIDIVVELIDDAAEAYLIVTEALRKRKHVVTANKKLLALHLEELIALQKEHGVSLLYEGAVCGSIPILRTLEEYFDNEPIKKVSGIFNGTSNYILSKMQSERIAYTSALAEAQEKGFAESDPSGDVNGDDAAYKAVIIALHAFGLVIGPQAVLNLGISNLQKDDLGYAREKGCRIKLLPLVKRLHQNSICVFVIPQLVSSDHHLFQVENEFNGVIVDGEFSGEQFLQGRGAGSYPTGAAVLSDISALSHGYGYEYKKHRQARPLSFTNAVFLNVYLRYNTILDLEKIEFDEIYEKYESADYNYVVGKIALTTLIAEKEFIFQNRLFVALINDETDPPTHELPRQKKQKTNSNPELRKKITA